MIKLIRQKSLKSPWGNSVLGLGLDIWDLKVLSLGLDHEAHVLGLGLGNKGQILGLGLGFWDLSLLTSLQILRNTYVQRCHLSKQYKTTTQSYRSFRQGGAPVFNTLVQGEPLNSGPGNLALSKLESSLYRMVLILSLIHIWRCRRSTLCRSRWSPYH